MITRALNRLINFHTSSFVIFLISLILITLVLKGHSLEVEQGMSPTQLITLMDAVRDKTAFIFYDQQFKNYTKIAIHPNTNVDYFYVGAENHILRLKLSNLYNNKADSIVTWMPIDHEDIIRKCMMNGIEEFQCRRNKIFHLSIMDNNKLLACGTYGGSPNCNIRNEINLSYNIATSHLNLEKSNLETSKSIVVEDNLAYVAAYIDRQAGDPVIYRIDMTSKEGGSRINRPWMPGVRNMPGKWLITPVEFINTYIWDDYAYYFFREKSEEMETCGTDKMLEVSRVARLCKLDPGGYTDVTKNFFLTFVKARLVCSTGGNLINPSIAQKHPYPFVYNQLQSTIVTDTHVFGVFTTALHEQPGSAICGFPRTSIDKVLSQTQILKKVHPTLKGKYFNAWNKTEDPIIRPNCDYVKHNQRTVTDKIDNHGYNVLRFGNVYPDTNDPLSRSNERWSHLAIHQTPRDTKGNMHTVAFVVTDKLTVKKILLAEGSQCFVEEYQLEKKYDGHINDIKLVPQYLQLVITTDNRVIKLALFNCEKYKTKQQCLNIRDPYCGWNTATSSCTALPRNSDEWQQDISKGNECADTSFAVRGAWSSWSSWEKCPKVDETLSLTQDHCLCRHRKCNNPAPRNGGSLCGRLGDKMLDIQMSNCSQDGAWTTWSEWSTCKTCLDRETRSRVRVCDNPPALHGGKTCPKGRDGLFDVDIRLCEQHHCPRTPVDGNWSPWGMWGPCNQQCGGGVQIRKRFCNSPAPINSGMFCLGDSQQIQQCNELACQDQIKTVSTVWMKTDSVGTGFTKLRYNFRCHAVNGASSGDQLELQASVTNETQKCASEHDCSSTELRDRDGEWGLWMSWSTCTKSCDKGTRTRTRLCDNPTSLGSGQRCMGDNLQSDTCNAMPCPQYKWSPWNCWSDCQPINSKATCGPGNQFRQRQCESTDTTSADSQCLGEKSDFKNCDLGSCDFFTPWSSWSECQRGNVRIRTRKCTLDNPTNSQCRDDVVQSKLCFQRQLETEPVTLPVSMSLTTLPSVPSLNSAGGSFADLPIAYGIGTFFVSFILGALVTALVMWLVCSSKNKKIRQIVEDQKSEIATLRQRQDNINNLNINSNSNTYKEYDPNVLDLERRSHVSRASLSTITKGNLLSHITPPTKPITFENKQLFDEQDDARTPFIYGTYRPRPRQYQRSISETPNRPQPYSHSYNTISNPQNWRNQLQDNMTDAGSSKLSEYERIRNLHPQQPPRPPTMDSYEYSTNTNRSHRTVRTHSIDEDEEDGIALGESAGLMQAHRPSYNSMTRPHNTSDSRKPRERKISCSSQTDSMSLGRRRHPAQPTSVHLQESTDSLNSRPPVPPHQPGPYDVYSRQQPSSHSHFQPYLQRQIQVVADDCHKLGNPGIREDNV